MGAEGKTKLAYLESLRGIAALVVVFTHFAGSFVPAITEGPGRPQWHSVEHWFYGTPLGIVFGGNFSVCVFFVLSGFVLTRAFFLTGRTDVLAAGAIKRYFRLMPPVAVSVLLAYVLLRYHLFFNHQAAALTGSVGLNDLWAFPAHFTTAVKQAFYEAFVSGTVGAGAYNPPLWTMQIEFIGSFMVFGAAALFGDHPRRWWLYGMLVTATWQTYFLGFAFGLILADLAAQERVQDRVRQVPWPAWAMLVVSGLLIGGYPAGGSTVGTWYTLFPNLIETNIQAIATWHSIAALMLVTGVLGWSGAQRVLEWRPFVELGRQSFGLYLTHLMILATFGSYLFKSLMISHGYRTSLVTTAIVTAVVIFSVSWLYTRWVDQPAIAWAKRIGAAGKRPAVGVVAPVPATEPVVVSMLPLREPIVEPDTVPLPLESS
jgi:peptidoglycan/LPS O-acetylase OafA/YrhL